jgi:fatty-acyl-CoA synthase
VIAPGCLSDVRLTDSPLLLLDKSLRENAHRPAVVHRETTTTYAELGDLADRIAARLHASGVVAGDRVAVLLGNTPVYLAADLAILRLGAVKVALNQMLSAREVAHIVEHSGTVVVLGASDLVAGLGHDDVLPWRGAPGAVRLMLDDDLRRADGTPGDYPRIECPDPDLPLAIYYTGGTTGRSKGVVHTAGSLGINLLANIIDAEVGPGEQLLLSTPLSHAAGLFAQAGLARGGTLHVLERYSPEEVARSIDEGLVTWTYMVPTMLYRFLDLVAAGRPLKGRLSTLCYGSAPITPSRLREALEVLGPSLIQFYGQTECPNFGTRLSKADHVRALTEPDLLQSCGRSATFASASVMDESGAPVVGEVGEVCLSAPYLMDRYHDDPEATAQTKRGGWVRTGDIGVMDAEGYISLRDRKADMIISGGMNVYSAEVEAAIQELPGVGQVAVIGVPHPEWGEAVCAVVVVAVGRTLDERTVIEHCRDRVAAYKRPKTVLFVEEIPVTPFGKPDKRALRSEHWAGATRQIS